MKGIVTLLIVFSCLSTVSAGVFRQNYITGNVSSKTLQSGSFQIVWDNDRKYFSVSHKEEDRVIFETVPGRNFLKATDTNLDVHEKRGSFTVSERNYLFKLRASHQRVEAVEKHGDEVVISGSLVSFWGRKLAPYSIVFKEAARGRLFYRIFIESDAFNEIHFIYKSDSSEKFYGFGEQFTHLNMKGKKVPVLIQEGGIARGRQPITFATSLFSKGAGGNAFTSYASMPWYFTDTNRALFLENSEYCQFDLRNSNSVTIRLMSREMRGNILYGKTPLELIEKYTAYTGRMQPLPDWINEGAVVGMQGGTEAVRTVLATLENLHTPVAAFWLQDWIGKRKTMIGSQLWWNWELDDQQYPGWDLLQRDMSDKNIRLLGYINPFLVEKLEGSIDRNLYQEALENNYVINDHLDEPYFLTNTDFEAVMLDLSNPECRTWIKNVIKDEMIAKGFSGWMADFAEALPFDATLFSGEKASSWHNKYPVEWAKVNREAIQEAGREGDIVFFTRAGFTGSQKYSTLFWTGDQMVTWDHHDGLKSSITGLLSSGFSGISYNHSDIGGYTSVSKVINLVREKELLLRWMEANAFTAVYRTHEGNEPEKNIQFFSDNETLAHFAQFAKVYAALAFYRKELMQDAAEKGWPVVRHPLLHYPEDEQVKNLQYQWMIGDQFMVAPVVDKHHDTKKLYLPEGEWVHVWSEKEFSSNGIWITVNAPLGKPPVFFKKGSLQGEQFLQNLQNINADQIDRK